MSGVLESRSAEILRFGGTRVAFAGVGVRGDGADAFGAIRGGKLIRCAPAQ